MLFGLMTGLARSASATEGYKVHVLKLKLSINYIQHSSSPVAPQMTLLVSRWRAISSPRASTVNCQTCLENGFSNPPWRR